jgi:hypothetical protein
MIQRKKEATRTKKSAKGMDFWLVCCTVKTKEKRHDIKIEKQEWIKQKKRENIIIKIE